MRELVTARITVENRLSADYGNANCAKETIAAIESLVEQGATALIFDVRYNGGGYANEMNKVLDYLLPEGQLFKTVDYTGKEEVAAYIAKHGKLPDNFITKSQARDLGWKSGSVERFAPGKCIGGDRFGNYEGLLPDAPGRTWTECDIDTMGGGSRGAKRIVFSNDGLIFVTYNHYETFIEII